MKTVSGGVCAPKGYKANGIHCGVRANKSKLDLALIVSQRPAAAAAVYTKNLVKSAPILVTRENIADGTAQAVICNSGNANTCNADGYIAARGMCAAAAKAAGVSESDVIVASTGVIGQPLDITPIVNGLPELAAGLGDHSALAELAIMTTDTKAKEIAVEFEVSGVTCRMGGIAKGSGMIHPNMATMLVFITTDTAISQPMLQKALSATVDDTFNMISVDGDTSTNDMCSVLANGLAENPEITGEGEGFDSFAAALFFVMKYLSRCIAGDGEGATKLLECNVTGAVDKAAAVTVSKAVICSSLVKAAMFGEDANWGRILCAVGYSGAPVDVNAVDVTFDSAAGSILVCKDGAGVAFSEDEAAKILHEDEIKINIALHDGSGSATAWGCDLTYDYVKINGDYRT